jgi:hypothetical protein
VPFSVKKSKNTQKTRKNTQKKSVFRAKTRRMWQNTQRKRQKHAANTQRALEFFRCLFCFRNFASFASLTADDADKADDAEPGDDGWPPVEKVKM